MVGHKGQVVGYVRVSAADQNPARQLEGIGEVDRLFEEKVSGKNMADREQLTDLLAYVREGDTVRSSRRTGWRARRPTCWPWCSSCATRGSRWSSSTTPS